VTLAKHEIPKTKGLRALMPGYTRMDMTTGSLTWFILLKDDDSRIISRQGVVDSLMALAKSRPRAKRKKS
jgi:hypothetical protein